MTGAPTGWVLSPEKVFFPGADAVLMSGRQHRGRREREASPDPAWSETPCTSRTSPHGNREIPYPTTEEGAVVRDRNLRDTRSMHGDGKSDRPIVAGKQANNGRGAPRSAESVEPRGLAKENTEQQTRGRTQCRTNLQNELLVCGRQLRETGPPLALPATCASDPR